MRWGNEINSSGNKNDSDRKETCPRQAMRATPPEMRPTEME